MDARKIALGRKLFFDPVLSRDNNVSCASCHALEKGGTDRSARSVGINSAEGEINQTILNLIVNAAHAIADVVGDAANGKGAIRVSTRADGEWAEIRISDTGTGIPEHARARVFDPFFTTRKLAGERAGSGHRPCRGGREARRRQHV